MIQIDQKKACCGCWACVQRCPKQCITMHEDEEGFSYPQVDLSACTRCGLCEQVCPVLNQAEPRRPRRVYAAKNSDEAVRMQSASGGLFTPLAEAILAQGGVVFGAKFDAAWRVEHAYADSVEGIAEFRGSKYVQSRIGESYRHAETFLKAGRKVLFSGTPCQIAGLHRYLMRPYENLLTVDVVCHGVPSPKVWREYLTSLSPETPDRVRFRVKEGAQSRYLVVERAGQALCNELGNKNPYIQGFLNDLYLRPACHACPARCGKSGSDLTIADYWGIRLHHPEFDDDKGVGLALVNSPAGDAIYHTLPLLAIETTYEQALQKNPSIERSAPTPAGRSLFWQLYARRGVATFRSIHRIIHPSLLRRLVTYLRKNSSR